MIRLILSPEEAFQFAVDELERIIYKNDSWNKIEEVITNIKEGNLYKSMRFIDNTDVAITYYDEKLRKDWKPILRLKVRTFDKRSTFDINKDKLTREYIKNRVEKLTSKFLPQLMITYESTSYLRQKLGNIISINYCSLRDGVPRIVGKMGKITVDAAGKDVLSLHINLNTNMSEEETIHFLELLRFIT